MIAYTVLVSLDTGTVSFLNAPTIFPEVKSKNAQRKVLFEKQAVVAALTEKLQNAAAGVIVDYKGITVAEDTTLRTQCRENNIDYAVVKNTLLRFAFNNVGLNELDDQLNGATSLAVCMDDPVAPARGIAEFAKKLNGKFEIKGGFMDGKVVSPGDRQCSGCHPRSARAAGSGSGYHAGSHFRSGLRAEANCREAGRSRRGSRCRVMRRFVSTPI